MPLLPINGIKLHVEDSGSGQPIIFVHEFAGSHRSWWDQVGGLRRRYRCITYSARGYPPSEVPENEDDYGYDAAVEDIKGVLDAMGIDRAHVVGLSMGAYNGLMFAMRHPDRVRGLVAAGGGAGSSPGTREQFIEDSQLVANRMLEEGTTDLPELAAGPTRVQLQNKDPRAWQMFADHLAGHSPVGSAYTLRRVQAARPSLYDFEDQLRAMATPTLLIVGDEDEPCLDVNLFLKRTMPHAALSILPKTGHAVNLEEPAAFNHQVQNFLATVEAGRWESRDARAVPGSGLTAGTKSGT